MTTLPQFLLTLVPMLLLSAVPSFFLAEGIAWAYSRWADK